MVEFDEEVNEDIMNDKILPVPPDSAVLSEITKRLTRYNSALRTCSDNRTEDHGNDIASGKKDAELVVTES